MLNRVEERLRAVAEAAPGFMPEDEGLALFEAALSAPAELPWLEVGTYCGKSAVYLGAAARDAGTVLFTIDHHRGSEEHQVGEEYHDPLLAGPDGEVDTLPAFRATMRKAALDSHVIGIVAQSEIVARAWSGSLGLVFIDGGHSPRAATADYEGWHPRVAEGGLLIIHDVFEDPARGGRPPYDIWRKALESGSFREKSRYRTLRVLERTGRHSSSARRGDPTAAL